MYVSVLGIAAWQLELSLFQKQKLQLSELWLITQSVYNIHGAVMTQNVMMRFSHIAQNNCVHTSQKDCASANYGTYFLRIMSITAYDAQDR